MSAKATDLTRVQEIFNLIMETRGQMARLGITGQRFKSPEFAESIMNRVLRITEEAGSLSDSALAHYDFERRAIKGVRNRLAHAYGDVNADIIWQVIDEDFPVLLEGCQRYCDELGLELELAEI